MDTTTPGSGEGGRAPGCEVEVGPIPVAATAAYKLSLPLHMCSSVLVCCVLFGTQGTVLHHSAETVLCFGNHILFPCFLKVSAAGKNDLPMV